MPLHLVTGYAGRGHVSATDQGSYNIALYGMQSFVQDRGNKFAAQMLTNNKIRIMDGDIMMQGRQIRQKENTYEDLEFDNGTQGMKRNDLVVIHYSRSQQTGIESTEFRIIKGEAVEGAPADPSYTVGDITDFGNAQESEMPLYRVRFDNLNMVSIEPLFAIMPNLVGQIKQKISYDDIVQNAVTRDPEKIASAAVTADLQDQITQQNTKLMPIKCYGYAGSLDDLLKSNDFSYGFQVHQTQNATSNPTKGNVSFTITFRLNSLWGEQYQFCSGKIRHRSNFNGTITEWGLIN